MVARKTLALDTQSAAFVANEVAEGRYASASNVVVAGLRLLEERRKKRSMLRAAMIDGETSGEATPFDFDGFIAGKRRIDASGR